MTLKKPISKAAIYPGSFLQQLQRRINKGTAVKIADAANRVDPFSCKSIRATDDGGGQND